MQQGTNLKNVDLDAVGQSARTPIEAKAIANGTTVTPKTVTPRQIPDGQPNAGKYKLVDDFGNDIAPGRVYENINEASSAADEILDVARGGFGILGALSRFEKGVPDATIGELYVAASKSPLFTTKLQLSNLLSGGKKIKVDDVLLQLQNNSKFRLVSDLSKARVDVMSNGTFVFRHSAGTGAFSRATAHHEMLHLAQFLRDPLLAAKAKKMGFLERLLYEPVPALIGSPEIYGLPTLIATGTTIYLLYQSVGLAFELVDLVENP